jgi:Tol biopolymer transport system component
LIVATACVALMIPGAASAGNRVHVASSDQGTAVVGPKLTVLYPNDADIKHFNDISANGAHVYLNSNTDLVNDGGAVEASQPWDVIPYTATRIVPVQPDFVGLFQASPDGRSFVVLTGDDLTGVVEGGPQDLYLIHDGVAKLASAGTSTTSPSSRWMSDDGSRTIFTSVDDIASAGDSNGKTDLFEYATSTNQETLVNPSIAEAVFAGASPDGKHILVLDPNGDIHNLYETIGGVSTLRAKGTFAGFSADSSKAFFTTTASLVAGDTDGGVLDGYYTDGGGVAHLLNLGLDDPKFAGGGAPISLRLSPDGSHWLVSTDAQLTPDDTDLTEDWYVGTSSGWVHIPGNMGTITQLFTTANDSVIVWASATSAVAGDTNGTSDIYRWSAANPGTVDLLTNGTTIGGSSTIRALSTDGSRVIFSTDEDLGDGDSAVDIYRWEGGAETLLSPGSAADVSYEAASTDGQRVVFTSTDQLLPADTDGTADVYISDEDTTAPTATVSALSESGAAADLTLGSSDGSAQFFSCELDGNPQACGTSTHLTGLTAGSHTLDVTAYDAAWNASTVVHRTWNVDLTKPTITAAPTWTFRSGTSLSSGRALIRLVWTGADTGGSGLGTYNVEQSTDGAAYVRIATGLASPTWDRFLSGPHTYRFRVQAVDKAGNVGDFVYGSSFKLTAVSQASSGVQYGPTASRWHSVTSSTYWGGTAKYASTASSTASYTFTGRSFAWVSLKASTRGKANVYVDGVLKATIDLKSTSTLKQQLVWATTFASSARHTVMIKVLGTSGRPRVDVDGFFYGS